MSWQDISGWLPTAGSVRDWASYVGTLTGVASLGIATAAFIRSRRSKALDLRIELRKEEKATRTLLDELPGLIDHANSSRTSINIATGHFNSSSQVLWNQACETDRTEVATLRRQLPELEIDYRKYEPEELEAALIAMYELRAKAGRLREKYQASMSADDKARDQIQARHSAAVQAMKA
jgi:hypothetical protein